MSTIDQDRVRARVAALDTLMRSHAGGLALDGIDADGTVRVHFTGMCTGCELRPHTAATVILPGLGCIEGVARVSISGGRVSDEALARLAAVEDPAGRTALFQALAQIEDRAEIAS